MKNVNAIVMLSALLFTNGCLGPRLDRGAELINHPQFEAAVQAAPEWSALALDIIVDLEQQIEAQR